MCWQKIRLRTSRPRWLTKLASEVGWGIACSEAPPLLKSDSVRQCGLAILWRRTLGIVNVVRTSTLTHRAIAVKTAEVTYVSAYDPIWFDNYWIEAFACAGPNLLGQKWLLAETLIGRRSIQVDPCRLVCCVIHLADYTCMCASISLYRVVLSVKGLLPIDQILLSF